MSPKFISTLISCIFLHSSFSCKIHGTESGVCTYRYLPSTYQDGVRNELERIEIANTHWANGTKGPCEKGEADHCMPFCGKYIANYYPPCVPKETRAKDRWIEEQATAIINNRIELEKQKQEKRRFYKNKACQDAYKHYFCWVNFPRCDEFEETLPMCQSVCENFFRVCGYEEDMWMCHNLLDDELRLKNMQKLDKSSYFPGELFKENEYESKGRKTIPKKVCTPSVHGSAQSISPSLVVFFTFLIFCLQTLFL